MLRGHESLLRLVGKRRKLHPSVFCLPADEGVHLNGSTNDGFLPMSVDACIAEGSTGSGRKGEEIIRNQNCSLEWVPCPVCGKSIKGTDSVINNHLDTCLVKGTRRKSVQLTLFGSMQPTTKLPTLNVPKEDKKQTGKRKLVVHKTAGKLSLSPSPSLKTKLYDLACTNDDDDFEGDPLMGSQLCNLRSGHSKTEWIIRSLSVGADVTGGSSDFEKEAFFSRQSENGCAKDVSISRREDGAQCSYSNDCREMQGSAKEEITGVETMEYNTINVKLENAEDGSTGIVGVKVEDVEWTRADLVNLQFTGRPERICICRCHFATAGLRCLDTPQKKQNPALSEDSGKTNLHEASGHSDDSLQGEVAESRMSAVVGVIETCIVGRKFNLEAVCEEGMQVSVARDPDNPKDTNAIKILTVDGLAMGHLPRQVALYLSVLLDKKLVDIECFIVVVPEEPFEAVPIKLVCERTSFELVHEEALMKSWQQVVDASLVPPLRRSNSFKYQANFLCLMQTVLDHDGHLFSDDERSFLSSFLALSGDAQRFFIRLYQRKGPWFRTRTLNYSDVADVELASQELIAARYMVASENFHDASDAEVREIVEVLNVFELRQLVCSAQLKKKSEAAAARRDELVNWAISGALEKDQTSALGSYSGSVVKDMLSETAGSCIRVSDDALFVLWRLQRLFFLNGDQELSSFLLVDMGVVKYPQYRCNRQTPVFPTREALLEYEESLEVAQGVDMALEANDMTRVMGFLARARTFLRTDQGSKERQSDGSPSFLNRFTAARVYSTVCTLGVSILERERRYGEAVELLKELLSVRLQSGRRGYWTVRLSTDLDHLGRKEESLQVAERGVIDPWIRGGDRVALQRRVVRLSKPPRRWRKPPYSEALEMKFEEVQIRGRPLNCTTGVKSRFYGYDGQQCGVEELALQYYASEEGGGWQGMHSEGGVWMTLFGLLMWEILFADVPDVFQTSFQTAPLDLDTQSFYMARQPLIEARLQAICQGRATELLAKAWSKYHGTYCRGVNWDRYPLETLQTIAACIGGPGLSAVCRLLAEDHAGYTAGMPDLLLWRTYTAPTLSRRSTSDMNCSACTCSEEVTVGADELKAPYPGLPVPAASEAAVEPVKVERYILQGEAKLVEVKGPRDRLSEQQRAWIAILLNAGLSVQVCKVLENLEGTS